MLQFLLSVCFADSFFSFQHLSAQGAAQVPSLPGSTSF